MVMDGRFDDWRREPQARDPAGDATGAFDLRAVTATSRGSSLFLRVRLDEARALHVGPKEQGTLRLDLSVEGRGQIQIDPRKQAFLALAGGRARRGWRRLRYRALPTHAARTFELRVDLGAIDAGRGDTVRVRFGGSDRLDDPLALALRRKRDAYPSRSAQRPAGADLRVASYHTGGALSEGLFIDTLGHLLTAVRADVYCFQGEPGVAHGSVRRTLAKALKWSAASWHIAVNGGCVIATRHPMTPVDAENRAYAAGRVEIGRRSVLVATPRLEPGGFKGSPEDRRRIEQARGIRRSVAAHPQRAAVVAGNWALVGSARPLETLTEPDGPGLARARPLHLTRRSAITWRPASGEIPPRKVDYVLYDDARLRLLRRFVLDSSRLPKKQRARLGLVVTDSLTVSDHLMLVTDLAFREKAEAK